MASRESLAGARVRIPPHVVRRAFPSETVMLDLRTGRYHGLDPVAGDMLDALERGATVHEAARGLAGEYGQPVELVESDLAELVAGLETRGLVRVERGGPAHGAACGVAIGGCPDLPGLVEPYDTDGRALQFTWEEDEERVRAAWPADGGERVSEAFGAAGEPAFTVDEHPAAGWLIWAAGCGTYLMAPDGRTVAAARPPAAPEPQWAGFVLAQVVPFAALVQGAEVFHAAAVAWDGGAAVFSGASQVGKTSLAVRSMLLGARFLTDDVLAVSVSGGELLAHPGAATVSLRSPEAALLDDRERAHIGDPLPADEEERTRFAVASAGAPLAPAAVYFPERRDDAAEISFEPGADDPRLLLAASFNFVVRTPERLARQLDVCSRLAATARVVRVEVPSAASAAEVAEAARRHFRAA